MIWRRGGSEFLSAAICRQGKKSTFSIGHCLLVCQSLRHLMKPPWLSFENSWWCSQPIPSVKLSVFRGISLVFCCERTVRRQLEGCRLCATFSTVKAENTRSRNELSVPRVFHLFFSSELLSTTVKDRRNFCKRLVDLTELCCSPASQNLKIPTYGLFLVCWPTDLRCMERASVLSM